MKPDYCHVTLETYLNHKAFQRTLTRSNQESISALPEETESRIMKNVCVRVLPEISDEITGICSALDMSKSTFLRLAIDEAIGQAHIRIDHITKDEADWIEEEILNQQPRGAQQ